MVLSKQLLEQWKRRTDDLRADTTTRQVLPVLVGHPVVSSNLVAERVAVSERAARAALATLAQRDIVEPYNKAPVGPGRPRRYWVATGLIDIVTNWGLL
jgi:predicted ArsR family transcriptional regulator